MVDAPEKLWMTAEEQGWPGSFRSFRLSDLEHPEEYPAYVRSDLYEQVKRDLAATQEKLIEANNSVIQCNAERLARVVTDAMANAMLEFVHSKKASTLTNTEMFRQGIELALAEPAGELHGPYAWLSGDRSMSEDSWTLSDDPQENSAEYFSIPLYAKVDPFKNKVIEPAEDVAKARIERLQDAIEGECDGLAIDEERACSILDYLDMGAEPAGEAEPVADEDEREDRIAALPYPDEAPASEVLAYVLSCARLWVPSARIIGNARAGDIVRALTTPPASAIREADEVEAIARLLWERFSSSHVQAWEDETHRSEYRLAASDCISHIHRRRDARHEAAQFLYKHGDLTHIAAHKAIDLLVSNGFAISPAALAGSAE